MVPAVAVGTMVTEGSKARPVAAVVGVMAVVEVALPPVEVEMAVVGLDNHKGFHTGSYNRTSSPIPDLE